jgi:hypothetical protein
MQARGDRVEKTPAQFRLRRLETFQELSPLLHARDNTSHEVFEQA